MVRTETSIAWRQTVWGTWRTYLCPKKKVFDGELYFIGEALGIPQKGRRICLGAAVQETITRFIKFYSWTDSRVGIARLQLIVPGPCQWLT